MKLVAGTRGSKLAVAQTELICSMLEKEFPDLEIEKKIIKTKGDKILNKALDKIGDKGLFVKEIESQLESGEIDFAVHSLKDMPSEINSSLKLTKTPDRADARDILIINPKHKINNVMDWLKREKSIKIGTGSKRRIAQLLEINENIEPMHIRGNIDTRIRKLVEEDMDAIVLAAAGVERLKIENLNTYIFKYDEMIPAAGQGALAIEIKKENIILDKMFDKISEIESEVQITAERAFLKRINGGCHSPVGAISEIDGDELILKAIYGDEEYKYIFKNETRTKIGNIHSEDVEICVKKAENAGIELADMLIEKTVEIKELER